MTTRYNIGDFNIANPVYAGATVSFYTVSGGAKTTTLATLYAASTGTTQGSNPATLDSDGKLSAPLYSEVPVIATISGLGSVSDHDTGIMGLAEGSASSSATAAAASASAASSSASAAAASAAAAASVVSGVGQRQATTVGGTVDAITATFTPTFASLAASAGIVLAIPLTGANATTTPTLAIDGLTAKTIVKSSNTALAAGDIPGADFVGLFVYDQSLDKFQLINPGSNIVSQAAAEAGTSTVPYDWTPERVKQSIKVLGGTTRVEFTATGNTTIPAGVTKGWVTAQAPGGGGGGSTAGTDGGTLTFGPNGGGVVLTLAGGLKGGAYSGNTGGAGGAGGGSGLNQGAYGDGGGYSQDVGGGSTPVRYNGSKGGVGGSGMFGNLGGGGRGSDGTLPGGNSGSPAGGGGGAGEQVFRYPVTLAAGQWDVTIGSAGSAGTASGNGTASSAGKGGFLILEYL